MAIPSDFVFEFGSKKRNGLPQGRWPLLAARLTWSADTSPVAQFVDFSLEALRRRLSTGLPLSAGLLGKEGGSDRIRCTAPPAFGGSTSVTLKDFREW